MYNEEYYEKIKTPKELYEAIRLELKWEGPFALTPGDSIPELIQIAMRIRAENLPLDLGNVPTRCTVPDIQNWCINAQKVMDVAAAEKVQRQPPKTTDKFTAEQNLLAVLATNPDCCSVKELAKLAGVNRTTAYKCEKFMASYRVVKAKKKGKRYSYDDERD